MNTEVLMLAGLPALYQIFTPQLFLITCLTVGLLGAAVLVLTRPRAAELGCDTGLNDENPADAEQSQPAPETIAGESASLAVPRPLMKSPVLCVAANGTAEHEEAAQPRNGEAALPSQGAVRQENTTPGSASSVQRMGSKLAEPVHTGAAHRGPAHGASALIAKVASLMPAGIASPNGAKDSPAKPGRATAGFQPAARFSRSQQAFLRIPIVLTGGDESGREFREETCTLILLPQGAVIPMRNKVRAGDRLTLSEPARKKDLACEVFGAQPGPDGRILVEVEFTEPQKNAWPVSFPAWAGSASGRHNAVQPASAGSPARVTPSDTFAS